MPSKIVKQLKNGKGRGKPPAKPSVGPQKTNVKPSGPLPNNPSTGNPPPSGGPGAGGY